MSQQAVANQLAVTFKQIQKYEAGSNRVSASRLANLAVALEVPPSFFFDDLVARCAPPPVAEELHEAWELLRCYHSIKDEENRRKVSR